MQLRTGRLRTTVVAGCAVLALAGCATGDGDTAAPNPTDEGPGADDRPAPESDEGEADQESEEGPTEALATLSIPIGFIEGGELEVAVNSLEVTGELLRMALTFTASLPREVEEVAIGAVLSSDEGAPAAGISPELIDPVNLKAYDVVTGAIRSGSSIDLVDGSPLTIVFYYAAPEDDVETFDVRLSSESPALTDVPFEP